MKSVSLLILLTVSGAIQAAHSPTMRIHFGASNAIVRLQGAYFNHIQNSQEAYGTKPAPYRQMRLQAEALLMVNNHFTFEESVRRVPARFIVARAGLDGIMQSALGSVSFGQSLKCRSFLPFFGQIKGYWSLGAAIHDAEFRGIRAHPGLQAGLRAGFNGYNRSKAVQAEINVFKDRLIASVNVYGKINKHFLLNAGIENNLPMAGMSLLAGNFRIHVSSRIIKWQFQHGIQLTGNF